MSFLFWRPHAGRLLHSVPVVLLREQHVDFDMAWSRDILQQCLHYRQVLAPQSELQQIDVTRHEHGILVGLKLCRHSTVYGQCVDTHRKLCGRACERIITCTHIAAD
eukprot:2060630-Prymnesium_polylepis.1